MYGLLNIADVKPNPAFKGFWYDTARLTLQEIVGIEPRLGRLLNEAKRERSQNRDRLYVFYKHRLMEMVGAYATDKRVSSCQSYETAIKALCDALGY